MGGRGAGEALARRLDSRLRGNDGSSKGMARRERIAVIVCLHRWNGRVRQQRNAGCRRILADVSFIQSRLLSGKADAIVTGDQDLLVLAPSFSAIRAPQEARGLLGNA